MSPNLCVNSSLFSWLSHLVICLFACLFVFLGGGLITGDVKMRSLRQSLVINKSCSILIS